MSCGLWSLSVLCVFLSVSMCSGCQLVNKVFEWSLSQCVNGEKCVSVHQKTISSHT